MSVKRQFGILLLIFFAIHMYLTVDRLSKGKIFANIVYISILRNDFISGEMRHYL